MATYSFTWIDAFAERPFAGNPCAVVLDADDVDEATRIAFTRETRLSECAFVQSSETADVGARYYTAGGEIPMAGHPTVATATALVAADRVRLHEGRATFTLEVGAGILPIEVTTTPDGHCRVTMQQLRPSFGRQWPPGLIAPLVGLHAADLAAPPQTVSTGTPFLVTQVTSHEALRGARLDAAALAAFRDEHGADFFEPFLTAMGGATADGDVYSRLLLTPPEPPEDPFTGSATGCLGAWLWAHGHIDEPRFVAEQGHDMQRPGSAEVEVLGPRDDIAGVRVTGTGIVVMEGSVDLTTGPPPAPAPSRRPIQPAATGVTAFIGDTGNDGGPTTVSSWQAFTERFDATEVPGELPAAVAAFFRNGGRTAVVVASDATPEGHARARESLSDGSVDLVVLPPPRRGGDVHPTVVADTVTWAEHHGAVVLVDPEADWSDADEVLEAPRPSSGNAAVYWPRVLEPNVEDPDEDVVLAPSGAIAGIMARTDASHGVWQSPAGLQATLDGVVGLSHAVTDRDIEVLNPAGVNSLRVHPRAGVVPWGARTSSTDGEWRYVAVRRTALFLESSLEAGLAWAAEEPNDEPLWAEVRALVEQFLADLLRRGAFVGTRPQDGYVVRCDRTTMSPADIAAGRLRAVVGFAPMKPAEFVMVTVEVAVRPGPGGS